MREQDAEKREKATAAATAGKKVELITEEMVEALQNEMLQAAEDLEFEKAGVLRDRITLLQGAIGQPLDSIDKKPRGKSAGKGRGRRGRARRAKVPRPRKQD